MAVIIDFQEIRIQARSRDLANFLNCRTSDPDDAVELSRNVLNTLRDKGRTPETEYLALQFSDLFLLLIRDSESDPDSESRVDLQDGSCQFG